MTESIKYMRWIVNIIAAAHADRDNGTRRFGEDFPMEKLPKSLNRQGASNLAATIYNVAYEGWEP